MEKNKDFLGTQPVGKLLFKLAIPTVIAQLINMLYNIVDRIFIGHIPDAGSLALTGVGVTMPIIMIVSAFAGLVSSGGAPRASISMGKGDMDSAEQTLGGCFLLQVIVSIVLTVVLLLFGENLLLAFGASENTISYAASYLNIYAFGTLFVQLTLGMNAFVTAEGFTKISMVSVAIGAILNIVLDPIMIFGLNMGVRGAALATVISQAVSCIVVVAFLCSKKSILRLKRKNLNIKPKVVFPCIALGTAAFIMQASESVISVCFNSSLLKYGGDIAVGAMTILTSVMQFAMLPLQGIAQGAQPITSYNYGANNTERVKKTFRVLLTVNLFCHTLAGSNAYATILCEHFYSGDSDDRVRIKSSACLYGSHVFIWYSDCMPDDLYSSWQCDKFYHCGSYKKIYSAVTINLYYATYGFKQNHGCLPCRAGSRFHSRNLYCNFVLFPV